jgi:hypothetical protein
MTLATPRPSAPLFQRSRFVGLALAPLLLALWSWGCGSTAPAADGGRGDTVAKDDAKAPNDGAVHPDADGSTCADPCPAVGTKECHKGGIRSCEQSAPGSCLSWSTSVTCAPGLTCVPQTVTCEEACGAFCDPFSIVLLPDTQYYTSKQANNASNTYRKQMQWIIDHRQSDNIQFVVHLGDITNNNTAVQWQTASDAHAMLDNANIPYSVVTGNHDYLGGAGFDRGGSLIDAYFPPSRYAGKAWYGGSYGSSNANNYTYFANGDQKFLVLSLEYAPRKDVLCWASDIIASHPDRHVIIATHCYLTHGGSYASCPNPAYSTLGAPGRGIWDELVARHSNIFLVVSGHVGDSELRVHTTNTGYDVHEMLVDYQFEGPCSAATAAQCTDNCRNGAGNGWMRQLTFNPRKASIEAKTFTVQAGNTQIFPQGQPAFFCSELRGPTASKGGTWYAADPTSSQHQFSFTYDFVAPPGVGIAPLAQTSFGDRTVNSAGAGDQLAPVVAMAASGAFVVAWQDDSDASDGAGNHDIYVRGFAAGGCRAWADLRVNPNAAGHQSNPAIAMNAQGDFVVVWQDDTDGNGVFQIKARGFFANGKERFSVRTVNTVAAGQQLAPTVAMGPSGAFVVAWQDDPLKDGHEQILMRGFNADGSQRFADRSVHDDALGQRLAPAIGLDGSANIVVVWQDDTDGNGSYQIHARGFNANGSDRFARLTVNSNAAGQQRDPALAVASDGRFVVVWRDDANSDGDAELLARGFDSAGVQRFADFAVSATAGQHLDPVVVCTKQGDFAVTWADDTDGNGLYQIRARRYAAKGTSAQAEWTVNTVPDGQQLRPGAAINATGALVIAWQDDMDGNGLFQLVSRGY